MAETPNVFSTDHRMTTCGDGKTAEHLVFGFAATGLRIFNTCSDPLFYNLQTTATTADDFIAGCSAVVLNPLPAFGGVSLVTTSTSTAGGAAVARPRVGVSAWASA